MLLDRDQKTIFCRWLETQISSSKGILEQMHKMSVPNVLLKKERTEQAACTVVLAMLQSGEEVTLG